MSKKWIAVAGVCLALYAIGSKSQKADAPQADAVQAEAPAAPVDSFMDRIHQKVIDDAKREYEIASAGGSRVDRCVQAGLVAAAYLQAHDQSDYQMWRMRRESDCKY